MSVIAPPGAGQDVVAEHPSGRSRGGGFERWRSSWRLALTMARRDVRRYRGRSALIVVMVLVPTTLLSALVTIGYTAEVKGAERIPALMGNGQAWVEPIGSVVTQNYDGQEWSAEDEPKSIPGYDADKSVFDNASAVSALVGAPVSAVTNYRMLAITEERRAVVNVLGLDGTTGLGDKLTLLSGRWPAEPATNPAEPIEVLVTQKGLRAGLPDQGAFQASVNGQEFTLQVVGRARALDLWSTPQVVIAGQPPGIDTMFGGGDLGWIVRGDEPVTWQEVKQLNAYGLKIVSAQVLRHPPADADAGTEYAGAGDTSDGTLFLAMGFVVLILLTGLLVGPAFAVSATRQRRTLALVACNGATTAVLRRTVLAQAVVLGVLAAVSGVILGVLLAYVWMRTVLWFGEAVGPFDVRWALLVAIGGSAALATLVAALMPANRLDRLDIVRVMRGQAVSASPSRVVLVVGIVMTVTGGLATVFATDELARALNSSLEWGAVIGAAVLIVGSLCLVPTLLVGIGRLAPRLPTALRMATRDLARHRTRSAPTVAAVLGVVAGLTLGLVSLTSDDEQSRMEYQPSTLPGEILVYSFDDALGPRTEQLEAAAPGMVVVPIAAVRSDPHSSSKTSIDMVSVGVVPPGCTVDQALDVRNSSERCTAFQSGPYGSPLVLPAAEIAHRLDLDAAQTDALRAGTVVMIERPDVELTVDDTVRLVTSRSTLDIARGEPTPPEVISEITAPAITVPVTTLANGAALGAPLLMATEASIAADWPKYTTSWIVRDPSGAPVSDEIRDRLSDQLLGQASVQREDGFSSFDDVVAAVLLTLVGLLIMVVTLTATALSLAEQQSDHATLAALGATRRTRRVMAAAQAFALALTGSVLGVVVGLIPGIAMARLLTRQAWDPLAGNQVTVAPIVVIPWGWLAVAVVVIPLLAAALAAVGIRRAPMITRRIT